MKYRIIANMDHAYCRFVNNGNCPKFEAGEPTYRAKTRWENFWAGFRSVFS